MPISSALGSSALLPAGLGFRNVLINGGMQVAQRSSSVAVITASGYYTADRWFTNADGTIGTWTQSIESDAPADSGLANSLKMLCTTANASLDAADFLNIDQRIEGQNLLQFCKGTSAAKSFTLSFWVKSNVTGNYNVELRDITNTRSVGAVYNIGSSATWEKKTVTFPADTTGAFANNNTGALRLGFGLGMGSNYTSGTLATTWVSSVTANRWVGQTNLAAATNNYWQITGVQLEANYQPTPFEQRPIGVELALCQRYYWKWVSQNNGDLFCGVYQPASTNFTILVPMPTVMRARPTSATISGSWSVLNTSASPSVYDRGTNWMILLSTVNPGITNANQSGFYSNSGSSTLIQDAEL